MQLEHIAINSFICFGVYKALDAGMILHRVNRWTVRKRWPDWITKPLFLCPVCMASFWGTAYFVAIGITWYWLPFWILAVAGLNRILLNFSPEWE